MSQKQVILAGSLPLVQGAGVEKALHRKTLERNEARVLREFQEIFNKTRPEQKKSPVGVVVRHDRPYPCGGYWARTLDVVKWAPTFFQIAPVARRRPARPLPH